MSCMWVPQLEPSISAAGMLTRKASCFARENQRSEPPCSCELHKSLRESSRPQAGASRSLPAARVVCAGPFCAAGFHPFSLGEIPNQELELLHLGRMVLNHPLQVGLERLVRYPPC